MPTDYIHLLNCKAKIGNSSANSNNKCGTSSTESFKLVNCTRLTANLDGGIIDNYYNKPSHRKPYYYIINRTDVSKNELDGYDPFIQTEDGNYSYEFLKESGSRTCNQSDLFIEIHLGESTNSVDAVQIIYLRSPMYVSMTHEELLALEDNTQVLEFPDYVCYEIINIYVRLLLENASDPRLSTVTPINQSIAVG